MRNLVLVTCLALFSLVGCTGRRHVCVCPDPSSPSVVDSQAYLVQSTIWFQQSAEYRALCLQAFHLAQITLKEAAMKKMFKPGCVVVDIDETVLDNSPYTAWQIKNNANWSQESWGKWTGMGVADSVPGAPSFLKFAASMGVETFYVSNRSQSELGATMKNLQAFGFPYADSAHILLRTGPSSKEERRTLVSQTHSILILCGDNVEDFSNLFEGKSNEERRAKALEMQELWGTKFIVLPNPLYGSWEGGMDPNWRKMNATQKEETRRKTLRSFQ